MRTKIRMNTYKQVTDQNATLLALVQEQQKKIKEIMKQSKNLMEAMTKKRNQDQWEAQQNQPERLKSSGVNTAKKWQTITATIVSCWK